MTRLPAAPPAARGKARRRILVVDDEEAMRWTLEKALQRRGFEVTALGDGEAAVADAAEHDYTLVLMDLKMPRLNGFEALRRIRDRKPEQLVVLMTAYGTMRTAIDAMKEGAFDYITKPFEFDQIYAIIEKALMVGSYRHEVAYLSAEMRDRPAFGNIIGRSRPMQRVYRLIGMVAPTPLTVLIRGPSGTGKELVAQSIHHYSDRAGQPFVILNIAAVPPNLIESELFGHERGSFTGAVAQKAGKFELANQGTLFLDEIGDMGFPVQSKLLRVLEEREFYRIGGSRPVRVDVRVLAATNQDLERMVAEGRFRRDLYYRLNAVTVTLPGLGEHKEDLPLLLDYFMARFCEDLNLERKYLSSEAARLLQAYGWPGNIRELENTLKRAMVLAPTNVLLPEHFPAELRQATGADSTLERLERLLDARIGAQLERGEPERPGNLYQEVLDTFERPLLKGALRRTRGNKVRAAELLGINRNTLNKRIRLLGIE
jgi:two-component system nitrogen regulation response regulator GlnG